jgi:hypothetical protein
MTLKASTRTPLEVRADGIRELHPKRHSAGLADEPSSSSITCFSSPTKNVIGLSEPRQSSWNPSIKTGKPGCAQLPRIRSRTIVQGCGKIMALQVASY